MTVAIPPEALRAHFEALFAHSPPESAAILLPLLEWRRVPAEATLLTVDTPSDALLLIWEGHLTVTVESSDGRVELGEVASGDWVGEITFIEPGLPSADVRTSVDSVVLVLKHGALHGLILDEPATARGLLHALSADLIRRLQDIDHGVIAGFGGGFLVADEPDGPIEERRGWLTEMWSKLTHGGRS